MGMGWGAGWGIRQDCSPGGCRNGLPTELFLSVWVMGNAEASWGAVGPFGAQHEGWMPMGSGDTAKGTAQTASSSPAVSSSPGFWLPTCKQSLLLLCEL